MQQRYTAFCRSIIVHPILATEQIRVPFAAHLATINISHATIKVYLSATHQLNVAQGCNALINSLQHISSKPSKGFKRPKQLLTH